MSKKLLKFLFISMIFISCGNQTSKTNVRENASESIIIEKCTDTPLPSTTQSAINTPKTTAAPILTEAIPEATCSPIKTPEPTCTPTIMPTDSPTPLPTNAPVATQTPVYTSTPEPTNTATPSKEPAEVEQPLKIINNCLIGKDNWIYFWGNNAESYYRGTNILDTAAKTNCKTIFEKLNDACKAKGITLVIATIPNKEQVYPEHMPQMNIINTTKRQEDLLGYLQKTVPLNTYIHLKN